MSAARRLAPAIAQPFAPRLKPLIERHPGLLKTLGKQSKWPNQLGTLGSGNHFIELCLDEDKRVWLMLHSGSRGIGKAIAADGKTVFWAAVYSAPKRR